MVHLKIFLKLSKRGQSEALFLVPGFSANHHMWDNIVPLLTDKFRVIQLDNRGAGLSDVPSESFSIERLADDIAAFARLCFT